MDITPKQRYFNKVYTTAPMVKCKCGCDTEMKSKDKYGRDVEYISGHNTRKYKDPQQHKREWNHRNRESRQQYKEKFQRDRKVKLIMLLGGKCGDCPEKYDGTNACIFQFHHLDPSKKAFALNLNKMGKSWDSLIKELDKCRLLCSNCHSKKHSIKY